MAVSVAALQSFCLYVDGRPVGSMFDDLGQAQAEGERLMAKGAEAARIEILSDMRAARRGAAFEYHSDIATWIRTIAPRDH